MSCRSTPAGSFITTFVAHEHRLFDAQVTSMLHELRRRTLVPVRPNLADDYIAAVQEMRNALSRIDRDPSLRVGTDWTATLIDRALHRGANAVMAGAPEAPLAHAFLDMPARAREASIVIDTSLEVIRQRLADQHLVPEFIRAEYERLYREGSAHPGHFTFNIMPQVEGMPSDRCTEYAFNILYRADRCGICGQFIGTVEHTCPTPRSRRGRTATDVAPTAATGVQLLPSGVVVPVEDDEQEADYEVNWDDDQEAWEDHEALLSILNQTRTTITELGLNGSADTSAPTTDWVGTVEPVDMETFQAEYDAARAEIAAGNTRIPRLVNPLPGQVTAGLGNRGVNSFGIEIELDFPDDEWPYSAREAFAQRLHAEGIVTAPFVQRWHHVGDDRPGGDYEENPNGWICEFDRSVDDVDGERGVEIKSQILYDEPATWYNIERICAIAQELGAQPTRRTGLHVNVGGANFSSEDPSAHTTLLRLAGAYDDTLIRLAHSPESANSHRGRAYCQMAHVPPNGFHAVANARAMSSHYQAFNLSHLPSSGERHRHSSRVEVRLWDSTTDPGRIQAAVSTSLAMVAAAVQDIKPGQEFERAGSHRNEFGREKLTGEDWTKSTESFRRFLAVMEQAGMNAPHQRQALVKMFAESRWQSNN